MKKTLVPIGGGETVPVFASPKVALALQELTKDMSLYHGVRLAEVVKAVYKQGQKDGARRTFEELDDAVSGLKSRVPHRPPGRPARRVK